MPSSTKTKHKPEASYAVIYARYSSHGQQEQSIDGQLRDCHAYAEREGLQVVGEYIDRALSATTDMRPDFQRMINDSAKGHFQCVIVWKLDRFARNRYDSAHYKRILKKNGVRVVSAMEKISSDPEGIILEGVIESIAEYYSASLSQNVRRGNRENIMKGHYLGGTPPFGFKAVDKKLVADEENAPIIRYVFEEYAKGSTKKQIMESLVEKGLLSPQGGKLRLSTLQHALRNEKYMGHFNFEGETIMGICEPLISEETFNEVQRRLDSRSHGKSGENARHEYLLHGKAFCGLCGSRLVGVSGTGKSGNTFCYYACGKSYKSHDCEKKNEKKGFLEWYVVEQTVEYVLNPERMDYIASRIVERYEEEFNDHAIADYERKLAKIDKDANAAVDASIKCPEQARQIYYDKLEMLMAQKAEIEKELVTLRIAVKHKYTNEQIMAWLKLFTRGELLDSDFQKQIIDVFVNSVFLYDDKLVIYYNIKGGKQISYIEMLDSTEEPPFGGNPCACNGGLNDTCGVQIANKLAERDSLNANSENR